jgi:hypothetical protein
MTREKRVLFMHNFTPTLSLPVDSAVANFGDPILMNLFTLTMAAP